MSQRQKTGSMSLFVISFVLWAVVHSLTAAQFFKDGVKRIVGETRYQQTYRLLYTGFSLLSILPVFYFYWRLPTVILWQADAPWSFLLNIIQGLGVIGAAVAVIQTDAWSFIGLRQFFTSPEMKAQAGLGESLYISGLYRWMRHPLYTFSMLILWCAPTMSQHTFIFNLMATAYFIGGSILEEQRLTADFGQAYSDYQEEVPRFIPYRRPYT